MTNLTKLKAGTYLFFEIAKRDGDSLNFGLVSTRQMKDQNILKFLTTIGASKITPYAIPRGLPRTTSKALKIIYAENLSKVECCGWFDSKELIKQSYDRPAWTEIDTSVPVPTMRVALGSKYFEIVDEIIAKKIARLAFLVIKKKGK